jgi:hypothetical protein
MENTTSEEKLDYIYKTLKKQERRLIWSTIFKWWFRLFLLAYFYYAYVYVLPSMIDTIKTSLTPDISKTIDLDWIKDKLNIDSLKEKLKEKYNNY